MGGFVRGLLWGSLVAAGGLVVVSQIAGPIAPVTPPQQDVASAVPGAADPAAPGSDATQAAVSDTTAINPQNAPAAEPPSAPLAVVDTPTAPDSAGAASAPPTLPAPADAPSTQAVADVPSAPNADRPAATAPAPAEPPAAPPSDAPAEQMAAAGPVLPPTTPAGGDAPLAAARPATLGMPQAEGTPAPADLPPPPPLLPEEEALLMPLPDAVEPAQPVTEPADPTPELAPPPEPTREPAPAQPETGSAPMAPTRELTNQVPGVVTGRLPRIGATPAAVPDTPETAPDAMTEDDTPPLQRFARPFENPDQKPLFAILLQDNGGEDINRVELAALALPLSIVIDPLSEGAAERAAIWRAGGQEVVMAGTGIPAGAGPGDLEQSFQVLSARLPEAVAVIDPDGRAFQNNRPLATQIVPILAEQGRGLVTFEQGLNAADQVARREGLAAAMIFRSIDGEGEGGGSAVIRRYLDRAAFKAAQEGRVIVVGTLRPETVAGVLEWAVEGRASTVALAPISAMLQN
ncbi:MAG: divergent polysaccharide deacetylase family protein [Paracoccaceae bacterium]